MKSLTQLFQKTDVKLDSKFINISINSIKIDHRTIKKNDLFVAQVGVKLDSHKFINEAITNGASVVVCEQIPENTSKDFPFIVVGNSRKILGTLASNYYDNPSEKIKLLGVTGTNGKTTVCTLMYNLFRSLGYKSALLSTVKNIIGDEVYESTHTTPDPISLNKLLAETVKQNCTHCFMEVSSHSVDQYRIEGLQFTGAVFTNITHDHLDYHKTFDNYLKAKKKFFDQLPYDAFALSNKDDKNGKVMLQNTVASKYYYSFRSPADFKGKIIESDLSGMLLEFDTIQAWYAIAGEFNAYNLLAVYASAFLLGIEKEKIITALSLVKGAKGRFEVTVSSSGVIGIVDYAHTPDAVANVLNTINHTRTRNETLFIVLGCGGDRDKEKRPIMADLASTYADKAIFTSDNPRSENPETILSDMMKGVKVQYKKKVLKITKREEAIDVAVSMAQKGDIILVAGKGHENYQEIEGIKHPFDDLTVLTHSFEKHQ
ncbi:MAG: UDP-N-acetylmuramoyl-L-alanyl-D-glutamate--2,6-diaminopimelate ligase [Flavobacteriales bacterium]|nr:UDP-N-acetylmuramoyl-L-alanyl-D-glutamate--2,6-diaminopimelate ligase [Flavobacteriales bacterium]